MYTFIPSCVVWKKTFFYDKNLTFFQQTKKLPKILIFFLKIANGNFFKEKIKIFVKFFFEKNVKFLSK